MQKPKSNLWFVSLEHLLQDDGVPLRPADSDILPTDYCLDAHSPFTISLESLCVFQQLDRKRNGNDLLVRSWTTYGDDPPLEIVHFFEKNMQLGVPKDNLAVEHMFSSKSYGHQSIELDIEILEVDGHSSIAEDLKAVARLLGAVFPAILPFSSLASTLYSNLKNLFRNPHDVAFSRSFKLYSSVLSSQLKQLVPLRCGAYIVFNHDVEGDRYKLRELKLEPHDSTLASVTDDYVVIKIIPQTVNSISSEDLLANQHLAISLLKKDTPIFELPPSIQAKQRILRKSFGHLKSTAKHAQMIDYLIEYKKLKKQRLVNQLAADISENIPSDTLNKLSDQTRREKYIAQKIRALYLHGHDDDQSS